MVVPAVHPGNLVHERTSQDQAQLSGLRGGPRTREDACQRVGIHRLPEQPLRLARVLCRGQVCPACCR